MSAPLTGNMNPISTDKIGTYYNPQLNTYFPAYQIIGNVVLTGNGQWFNGLSSTPNTPLTSPYVSEIAVPTAFITKKNNSFQSSSYFMYSLNNSTTTRRTKTIRLSFQFEDNIGGIQAVVMNIPANQMVRIGIPSSVFTDIDFNNIIYTTLVLTVPGQQTLFDMFQETPSI